MTTETLTTEVAHTLLRLETVLSMVALSKATIYRMIAAGTFPAPVKIGVSSRWRSSDVATWITSRA